MSKGTTTLDGEQVRRLSTTAANTFVSRNAEDILYNLLNMREPRLPCETKDGIDSYYVTPYHMMLALNKSGLMHSLLEETGGSPEVLLSTLFALYENMSETLTSRLKKEDQHLTDLTDPIYEPVTDKYTIHPAYVAPNDRLYAASLLHMADFLKYLANDGVQKEAGWRHPPIVQQEDAKLLPKTLEGLPAMADELYCEALLNNAMHGNKKGLVPTLHMLTGINPIEKDARSFIRQFANRAVGLSLPVDQTQHYQTTDDTAVLFAQYVVDLIDREIAARKGSLHMADTGAERSKYRRVKRNFVYRDMADGPEKLLDDNFRHSHLDRVRLDDISKILKQKLGEMLQTGQEPGGPA